MRDLSVKRPEGKRSEFRRKAAALREAAEGYHPELKQGMLDLADRWEQLGDKIEADGTRA